MDSIFVVSFEIALFLLFTAFLVITLRGLPRADRTRHLLVNVSEMPPKKYHVPMTRRLRTHSYRTARPQAS